MCSGSSDVKKIVGRVDANLLAALYTKATRLDQISAIQLGSMDFQGAYNFYADPTKEVVKRKTKVKRKSEQKEKKSEDCNAIDHKWLRNKYRIRNTFQIKKLTILRPHFVRNENDAFLNKKALAQYAQYGCIVPLF